jgi:hypothetical protein
VRGVGKRKKVRKPCCNYHKDVRVCSFESTIQPNIHVSDIRGHQTYGLGGESSSAGDEGGGDGGLHFVCKIIAKRLEVERE